MRRKIAVLLLICSVAALVGAVPALAGMKRFIDDNDTVVLHGNTHRLARPENQVGLAPASLPLENMIMSLQIPQSKQAELHDLVNELNDPSSPRYQQWLTPEEFGAKFGPSDDDVADVAQWLTSHGFEVEEVGKGKTWINFSGDVSKVEQTFKTRMKTVKVGGRFYHANDSDPSIPRGLADVVSGIVTLHDFPRQPKSNRPVFFPTSDAVPNYTSGSAHYMAPGDFATIYNLKPLYTGGLDGTGQSIAIVGRTRPSASNWATFRSMMGLPYNPPQVIINGVDPGDQGSSENTEADLDIEWAGAVAKNATIKFVTSKSTYSTDGVDLSAQYIVNHNVAPIMSVSFGSCESDMGTSENAFYKNLWAQAAAQGITVFVSSGDSGAAGCSAADAASGSVKGVNGLASTPYNIAVGGTQFNEGTGTYWSSVTSNDQSSALSYIPEVAWNESGAVAGGSGLWATGGGVSQIYGKPSWQAAPGVPQDGRRSVPDVSLSGAGHDSYLVYTGGSLAGVGGTSAASPSFAGLMALVLQKTGQRQGNANVHLYRLANNQYSYGGPAIFHDIRGGGNSVPGVTGYSAGAGYDLATGLGSVNAYAMVTSWGAAAITKVVSAVAPDFALAPISPLSVTQGKSGSVPVKVSLSGGFNSSVSLKVSGLPAGVTATLAPATFAAPGAGSATLTLAVPRSAVVGTKAVTVTATGAGVSRSRTFNLTVAAAPDFTLRAATPLPMIQGSIGSIRVSTAAVAGFNSQVAFAVSGLPAGVTVEFSPATLAAPGTGGSTAILTLSAAATLGSHSIAIRASGGGITHSVVVPFSVVSGTVYSNSLTGTWPTAFISGTAGKWTLVPSGSNPSALPHSGTSMALFNSRTAPAGSQARIYSGTAIVLPAYARKATLSFWVYHDTARSTLNDKVLAQLSLDGVKWATVGTAVPRYNGTTGWRQASVDMTPYIGKTVKVGFLGISAGGNNMYLDDVKVTVK